VSEICLVKHQGSPVSETCLVRHIRDLLFLKHVWWDMLLISLIRNVFGETYQGPYLKHVWWDISGISHNWNMFGEKYRGFPISETQKSDTHGNRGSHWNVGILCYIAVVYGLRRFHQRFKSSTMWHCVSGCVVLTFHLHLHGRASELLDCVAWLWRWRHYCHLKYRKVHAERRKVTSQKTWIFINTGVSTPYFTQHFLALITI
jgi:hypothetical protein